MREREVEKDTRCVSEWDKMRERDRREGKSRDKTHIILPVSLDSKFPSKSLGSVGLGLVLGKLGLVVKTNCTLDS